MFTLSFFRGEAELTDLELRPEVLQQLLGLPPWLILRKATIGSIRASVTWTKIKSTPIRIIIDEMQVKLEATGEPTPDDFVTLDPKIYGLDGTGPQKTEKYGFIDGVTDGVQIDVTCIDISVHGTEGWQPTQELKYTRKENRNPQHRPGSRVLPPHITLFKILTIHELRGWISPRTHRIAEAASADPFTFSISNPRIRLFLQKSLLDNTKILSNHMTLDIDTIRQEVSRFQIQTLNHFMWSMTKMMANTRGFQMAENDGDGALAAESVTDFGVHFKIKQIEIALKNHIHTLGQNDFLTKIRIAQVTVHHFAEKRVGAKLESKDALRQSYLRECSSWMKAVNDKWTRTSGMTKREKALLRQATTSISVGRFQINTLPELSTKERAKLKRGSVDPVASAPKGDAAIDRGTPISLLDCNYDEYHLPPDLAMLQLDIVSFFLLADPRSRSVSPERGLSSPPPRTPTTTLASSGVTQVPPTCTFGRMNPVKVNLNLPAVLNLMEFANSCRLATAAISSETSSTIFNELAVDISLCPSQDLMPALKQRIEEVSSNPEIAVTVDEIKELKRVFSMRMEELQSLAEASGADSTDTPLTFPRYSIEVQLPTVVLPRRLDGPDHMRNFEIRFTLSRATITNAMEESRFSGARLYDDFYNSPLVAHGTALKVDVPLTILTDGSILEPLPRRSWLPDAKYGDTPDVMHINIDQIWGDVYNTSGGKTPFLHRVGISIFTLDTTPKLRRMQQMKDAVQKSADGESEGASSSNAPNSSQPLYAAGYTLVSINENVRVELNNSTLLFLMRFTEEFTKLTSLMDDGSDLKHNIVFTAVQTLSVSLYAQEHMLDPKLITENCIAEQRASGLSKKPFQFIEITRLHNLVHSGGRTSTQLYAIEDVDIGSCQFELRGAADPKTPMWENVMIAMRSTVDLASAEHTYRFYQQLDAVLLEKEAGSPALQVEGETTPVETDTGDSKRSPFAIAGSGSSETAPNLLYYLQAKKDGTESKRALELNHLPAPDVTLEVRGLNLKTDSNTTALLTSIVEDYFPDDTYPPQRMHLTLFDTDVVLLDNPTRNIKLLDHFRLISPDAAATNYYRLDGVDVVRDGQRWSISSGRHTSSSDDRREMDSLKKDEQVNRLENELARAREVIAAQTEALAQAEATRRSLVAALEESKPRS